MPANGCTTHGRWKGGCPDCQRLTRIYERRRRAAINAGTWLPAVPQAGVQAHIDMLRAGGMSPTDIARQARLSLRTVQGVKQRIYVQGPTAAAILAVQPTAPGPPLGMVSAIGSRRRVQALAAMGWSLTEQAHRSGMCLQQVWQLAQTPKGVVTVSTDRKFRDLFEQLSATPGPSKRSRTAAAKNGWVPPLAWNDIDDPDEVPDVCGDPDPDYADPVAVSRALDGDRVSLTGPERAEALRLGVARGESLSAVAATLHMNYFHARQLTGAAVVNRERRDLIDAEVERLAEVGHKDSAIGALIGIHHQSVSRARRRIAARQTQMAS